MRLSVKANKNKTEILYCDVPRRASYVYIFRNLLGLLESAIMLQTSTLEINV